MATGTIHRFPKKDEDGSIEGARLVKDSDGKIEEITEIIFSSDSPTITANFTEEINNLIANGDIDTSGEGTISADEYIAFINGKNRDLIIDVLVNHKNPLYNHEDSVLEYSRWRALQNKIKFDENKPDKPDDEEGLFEKDKK